MSFSEQIKQALGHAVAFITAGGTTLSQEVFDLIDRDLRTVSALKSCAKACQVNLEEIVVESVVALGFGKGLQQKLLALCEADDGGEISQTNGYILVDLWGRLLGVEALLNAQLATLDRAKEDGVGANSVIVRLAAVFEQLEEVYLELAKNFARVGAISIYGELIEKVLAMVRAHRNGKLGVMLDQHVSGLIG